MYDYFHEHATNSPERPAVYSWDGSLTYGELLHHSRALANRLLEFGIGEGSIVPLCFEKCLWTTVALLAVMRTGACFTLMDPSQPLARLQTIAEQVRAKVVLTSELHQELGQQIRQEATVLAIGIGVFQAFTEHSVASSTDTPINVDAPMYIQFTSGSTGKPKGVVISFAQYSSGAVPRAQKVGYHAGSRCLDFPSYAFDVSIDCILCTLSTGGCICVPSEDDRLNNLGGAITTLQANMVHVTPSVARLLDPDILESVEVLGLGGEYVSPGDIEAWSPTCKIAIAYGPSECTVGCTINDETSATCNGIGKGVGGVTWIVDPDNHDRLLPPGAIGELLIEGPIVGDGYLDQPEKTDEVFIKDPCWLVEGHATHPGRSARLYKTGDLVRYDVETGHITFIGRKDQQVKLRGQRVELGEVEHGMKTALPSSFSAVADVLKFGGKGEPTLVAFLATSDCIRAERVQDVELLPLDTEVQNDIQEAEKRMAQALPRFMIPSAWILARTLPMLVSGKVDRKKLREVGSSMSIKQIQQLKSKSKSTVSPQSLEVEAKLLRAWKKVMGNAVEVTRDDSFFHIGGDSLRAMHLIAAARAEGMSLSVADVFNHPTLAGMALVAKPLISQERAEIPPFSILDDASITDVLASAAKQCGLPVDAIEDLYPCTPLQEGIMALSAKFSDAYVAQRVVNLPDRETAVLLHRGFETAAADACILRTRIVQVPRAGLLQVVVKQHHELELRHHTDLEQYLRSDQEEAMGLGSSLARFAIVNGTEIGVAHYVLTMHHALYDGWCIPLIVERVNRAFSGLPLSPSTPFKSFIRFLQDVDQSASDDFWTNHLHGPLRPQFPQLPYKNYQTRADSLLERYVPLTSYPKDHTIATLVRATWALVVAQQIAADDIVLGETLTGRNAAIVGAEEIEGPMITTVPLRIRVDRSMKTSQYLNYVNDLAISRIPFEHAGLQNIRRLSTDAREACELRTGLVLHPRVDDGERKVATGPADAFVPANEAEAAREALKFNTYALMLVITVDKNGFLIMASFDSNCVSSTVMNQVLEQFEKVFGQLCDSSDHDLATIQRLVFPDQPNRDVLTPPLSASGSPVMDNTQYSQVKQSLITPQPLSVANSVTSTPNFTKKEQILAQIWCRILGIDTSYLHADSDFFDFGDSISAMKVVSEARSENLRLTVAQLFQHRELSEIANAAQWIEEVAETTKAISVDYSRFSALDGKMTATLIMEGVKNHLADPTWDIEDVYPARPLQAIAVDGTVKLPRYSVRYEVIYFDHLLSVDRLQNSIQALVNANEILRTVFIKARSQTFGVVLSKLSVHCKVHDIDAPLKDYVQNFCALDVLRLQPLGSAFVDFIYVRNAQEQSALVFKLSHAQYDEICLPNMLHQLSDLYEGKHAMPSSTPFSSYVKHLIRNSHVQSAPYWRNLLHGSNMTQVKPQNIPLVSRKAISLFKTFDISARSKSTTIATLPTAAWALCLAKTMSIQDVVFGEVVSGRNTGLSDAGNINGPCWQYVPVRVQLQEGITSLQLLKLVQDQHIASSRFEGMGLEEIRTQCTDWPDSVDWFGSVVHQDVEHVTELPFGVASSGMETIYPHLETLRELKCQCFLSGQSLTIEIVLYESWAAFGRELLGNFGQVMSILVSGADTVLEL